MRSEDLRHRSIEMFGTVFRIQFVDIFRIVKIIDSRILPVDDPQLTALVRDQIECMEHRWIIGCIPTSNECLNDVSTIRDENVHFDRSFVELTDDWQECCVELRR